MTEYEELEAELIELQRQAMAAHIRSCNGATVYSRSAAYEEFQKIEAKIAQIPERRRELFRVIACGAPSRPMEPGPFGPKAA